ncbi:MAG: family 78 glycoside hydrolase catalytic domain, partial [Bacteroidaceae bacterium]|nr:family 78 glycoside hydrolase catalytic domain [Bacteroidaceae bacterium]
ALQAETAYSWDLTVWDEKWEPIQSSSKFETGLMDSSIRAWDGAQFVGSKSKVLDAASHNYFEISTDFQISKGDKASLIFGANDFRLKDAFQNSKNMSGTNYIRVEVDLSGVGKESGASLNVYRVGYDKNDKVEIPFLSINKEKFPDTNINQIFTSVNRNEKHNIRIFVQTSMVYFIIDGKDVLNGVKVNNRRFGGFAVGNVQGEQHNATRFQLGTYGSTHDYNTEPNLCSVGFAALPNSDVTFTNYMIKDCGQAVDKVQFSVTDYDLFAYMPGVKVNGANIQVKNDGKKMLVGYADPSRGGQTMLRTTFDLKKKIKHAKLYATAMGVYEMFINGRRVGEDWFASGDSQYRELLGYTAYDVTNMMTEGSNCLAAQLYPGWYTGYMTFTVSNYNFFGDYEALLSKLVVTYEDGSKEIIVSNPDTWQSFNDGPVRYGNFFNGERYDARKETNVQGWNTVGFDSSCWRAAQVIPVRDWIHFAIKARYDEPVRVREMLTATRVMPTFSVDRHTYIYNMGVNMVGVPSITVPEGYLHEGDTVILRYAEQLYPGFKGDEKYYVDTYGAKGKNIAGRPLYETLRAAFVTDFYVAKGSEAVVIQPTSTYRGYQYIQIT